MYCKYCNAKLIDEGVYGFLASHQSGEVLGRIYRCPNHQGFDTDENAQKHLDETYETLESLGLSELSEVCCYSSVHSVSGSYYTDKYDNLHDGYPC